MIVFVEHRRIGGETHLVLCDGLCDLMRIPDDMRKCALYVMYEKKGSLKLGGTGFVVSVRAEKLVGESFLYVVTARHVIDKITRESSDQALWLRFNSRDPSKSPVMAKTAFNDWTLHQSDMPYVDIAVCRINADPSLEIVHFPLNESSTVNDNSIRKFNFGVGDDVFLTGLFARHAGKQRNIPIVRLGSIAAMPEEMVDTPLGDMEAYLVETRSSGGLSGSPVFARVGPLSYDPTSGDVGIYAEPTYYLLGMVHGHWKPNLQWFNLEESEDFDLEALNFGISIVVPATKIIETINDKDEMKKRRKLEEQMLKKSLPTMDAAPEPSEVMTKERVEDAVREVARKRPDEGKKET